MDRRAGGSRLRTDDMRITPQTPDPLRPGSGRTARSGAAERAPADGGAARAPLGAESNAGDRIELSDEARRLAATLGGEAPPSGALTSEVARRVGGRIASGWYDRPEVRDELVRRIAQAFTTEGGASTERA
jgi:hypothetical protein